jgi:hypothetical protein
MSNIDLLEGVSPMAPSTTTAKTDAVAEIPEETIRKLKEELKVNSVIRGTLYG